MSNKGKIIKLKSKIFSNSNNGMINYDDIDFSEINIDINDNGFIYRIEDSIYYSQKINQICQPFTLFEIEKTNDYFIKPTLSKGNLKEMPNENVIWYVLKGENFEENEKKINEKSNYQLNEGDVFKLGRIYFRLLKIKLNSYEKCIFSNISYTNQIELSEECFKNKRNYSFNKSFNNSDIIRGTYKNKKISLYKNHISNSLNTVILPKINSGKKIIFLKKKSSKNSFLSSFEKEEKKKIKKYPCRICYSEEDNIENPLFRPCKCSGSMGYIHLKCLKHWIRSNIEFDNTDLIITYNINKIKCELCKENFPDYIKYNNRLYNIFVVEHNFNEFFIIETMRDDKYKSRFIHIISFDEDEKITFGRSDNCDFSIKELSISRIHCIIYKEGNNLFIKDNESKFGTLILNQNSHIRLILGLPLNIQIGKSYFNINVEQKNCLFCCNSEEKNINYNYQKQNAKFLNGYINAIIKQCNDYDNEEDENDKDNKSNSTIKKIKIKSKNYFSPPILNIDNSNLNNKKIKGFIRLTNINNSAIEISNQNNKETNIHNHDNNNNNLQPQLLRLTNNY